MKKVVLGALVVFLLFAGRSLATTYTFVEVFFGTPDDFYFVPLNEGEEVILFFDLIGFGGYAQINYLLGGTQTWLPTQEAVGFVPGHHLIESAKLSLSLLDLYYDEETATIKTGLLDGDEVLWLESFDLYYPNSFLLTADFDLLSLGFKEYLEDGRFEALVVALANPSGCSPSNFSIAQASLTVVAHTPEPASLILVGTGILGISRLVRKKRSV